MKLNLPRVLIGVGTFLFLVYGATVSAQQHEISRSPAPTGLLNLLKNSAAIQASSESQAQVAPVTFDIQTSAGTLNVSLMPTESLLAPDYRAEYTSQDNIKRETQSTVLFFKSTGLETDHSLSRFVLFHDEQNQPQLIGYILDGHEGYGVELRSANPNEFLVDPLTEFESQSISAHCGADHSEGNAQIALPSGESPALVAGTLKVLRMATEADFEFYQAEGNSIANANARILAVFNAVDAIYQYQVGLRVSIVYQHVWSTSEDPFTTVDATGLLVQFGNYWNTNHTDITYGLAHLFTTQNMTNNGQGGIAGVAWISAVCGFSKYGVSKRYTDGRGVAVVAHEVGHNMGSNHDSSCDDFNTMCPYLGSLRYTFSTQSRTAITSRMNSANCLATENYERPQISLSASNTSLVETGGTSVITAQLSDVASQDVSVTLNFSGTATISSDYTRSLSSLTIPAGATSASLTINSVSDVRDEVDETLSIRIAIATNAVAVEPQQVVLTIVDNDAPPTVSLSANLAAIQENSGTANFIATLSAPSGKAITVPLSLQGTASTGDYSSPVPSISIAAGSSSGSLTVTSINDALIEGPEAIVAQILPPTNATIGTPDQATITILDNTGSTEPAVSLSRNFASISEGATGSIITATLSSTYVSNVTVTLAFSGTASVGIDYSRSASQISIPAGALSGTIVVTGLADSLDEFDKTIIVSIASATNAIPVAPESVTIALVDTNATVGVSIGADQQSLGEAGGSSTITATLTAISGKNVTINLGFAGNATLESDYSTSVASIVIPAGSTIGSSTITSIEDTLYEGPETIAVSILSAVNATAANIQPISLSVDDNDPLPPEPTPSPTPTASPTPDSGPDDNGQALEKLKQNFAKVINAFLIAKKRLPVTIEGTTSIQRRRQIAEARQKIMAARRVIRLGLSAIRQLEIEFGADLRMEFPNLTSDRLDLLARKVRLATDSKREPGAARSHWKAFRSLLRVISKS